MGVLNARGVALNFIACPGRAHLKAAAGEAILEYSKIRAFLMLGW